MRPSMFRSARDHRTFLTILLTYVLDLVGYSIVFPVLAPLLLNPNLHFFAAGTPEVTKTTTLGLLFAVFGITQFFGAPLAGALADHYGRYRIFLATVGLSFFGYLLMAFSIYWQSIPWLFLGRMVTGLCSGNFALAQSATADLTSIEHRGKAFGILLGTGGLGFVIGPWIGGTLANPEWFFGSSAFLFAAIAALVNFLMICFFFTETWKPKETSYGIFSTFKDIKVVFHQKKLRILLTAYLLFSIGWSFFLVFSPTYLVQKFSMEANMIGDIFAYQALIWCFVSMYLNKELIGRFSLHTLVSIGLLLSGLGVFFFVLPNTLWPLWIIIPFTLVGAGLSWVNMGTLISIEASEKMQGRALGVSGSMWSVGQILAPLIAGPLAGWNIYSPLITGAIVVFFCYFYFLNQHRKPKTS